MEPEAMKWQLTYIMAHHLHLVSYPVSQMVVATYRWTLCQSANDPLTKEILLSA